MQINKFFILVILLILVVPTAVNIVSAQVDNENDVQFLGFELELLLGLINSILALILFIVMMVAYNRTKNRRLLYVSIAFLLFSIRSLLFSLEIFSIEISLIDPLAVGFDFAILLIFFFGILSK